MCIRISISSPGLLDGQERRFDNCFRRPDKCDYGTVGGFSRIDIQQANAGYAFYLVGYLSDDLRVLPFAEIGNTFDNG